MDRPVIKVFSPIFGSGFGTFLAEPILVIGKDKWDRLDLADMGVTQLRAARIVSGLAHEYRAKDTKDLFEKLSPASLAHNHGTGLHSLFVLWRAFEAKHLDPVQWYWKGREGAIVTFTAIKSRERRERAAEKQQQQQRTRRKAS